jgi:hypothetical protein
MSGFLATPEQLFTAADRADLEARGIALEEAERQLELLAAPPPRVRLLRPCRLGDGIRPLDPADQPRLVALADEAALAGRLSKFVPASGAATRMFKGMLATLDAVGRAELTVGLLTTQATAGDVDAAETLALLDGLERFAFYPRLVAQVAAAGRDLEALRRQGEVRPILEALLLPCGLGFADLPKGLIPFHRDPEAEEASRSPFAEHLAEALATVADADRRARLHLTIPAAHRSGFEAELERCRASRWAAGFALEVGFSHQEPATDTLALDPEGQPFRTPEGRLLFRPGGHGSLLRNLELAGGDLVFLRNIDNVLPARRAAIVTHGSKVLVGVLLDVQQRLHELQGRLERARVPSTTLLAEAAAFAAEELGHPAPPGLDALALKAFLLDRFERPLRVCGMVENRGEPGGGPFWVETAFGEVSLQIVEAAQIDPHSASQQEIVRASGYFNPVDLVCALRDRHGRPYALADFADPTTAFVANKSQFGRPLRALEHPGLWNGGMARWNTIFVEVPAETFAPVKTVLDLLRPEHGG